MNQQRYEIDTLNIHSVDVNSPIPLYQQVRIDLVSMLQTEKLKPGNMLPSEQDLAQAYNVSRQTLRQAIGLLAAEGFVERTAGRGTTILQGRNRLKFFLNQSFAQQMSDMGLKSHSEVLRQKTITIDNTSPINLQPKMGSSALQLIRLRFGDECPIGIQYTTIITDLCPELPTYDFSSVSLYHLLFNHYQLPIARIDQVINAVLTDEWHMNLLKVPDNAPLLLVTTTAYLENGDPIESSTSYYRADKYEFSVSRKY